MGCSAKYRPNSSQRPGSRRARSSAILPEEKSGRRRVRGARVPLPEQLEDLTGASRTSAEACDIRQCTRIACLGRRAERVEPRDIRGCQRVPVPAGVRERSPSQGLVMPGGLPGVSQPRLG